MASPRFAPSWRLALRALRCRPAAAPSCFTSRPLLRQNLPQRRLFASEPPRGGSSSRVKFWPFIAIIAAGSAGYVALVNRRRDMPPDAAAAAAAAPQLPPPDRPTPAFSPDAVSVVFVLGGPGAGKGTQCERLVARHGFTHLSTGDLLRAEQDRPGSQFGDLIRDYIKNGQIVPMEVTIQLLENAMAAALAASPASPPSGRFLIDGFPRKMDQALRFEHDVCPAQCVLFYDCPEHVMERRLLERGKTSGRADDNSDSIRKRFRTFVDTSMPVVNHYDKEAKVIKIDATAPPDVVFAATEKRLADRFGSGFLNK